VISSRTAVKKPRSSPPTGSVVFVAQSRLAASTNRLCRAKRTALSSQKQPLYPRTRTEVRKELEPFAARSLSYEALRQQVLRRDGWHCQSCGAMSRRGGANTRCEGRAEDNKRGGMDFSSQGGGANLLRQNWLCLCRAHGSIDGQQGIERHHHLVCGERPWLSWCRCLKLSQAMIVPKSCRRVSHMA